MALEIFTSIDLNQNELQGARLANLTVAPVTPVVGQIYFDTVLGITRIWNGTTWQAATAGGASGTKFAANVGDGLTLVFAVTHNLNTKDFVASIFDNITFNEVMAVISHTTANIATITFSTAPLLNQYRVTILA